MKHCAFKTALVAYTSVQHTSQGCSQSLPAVTTSTRAATLAAAMTCRVLIDSLVRLGFHYEAIRSFIDNERASVINNAARLVPPLGKTAGEQITTSAARREKRSRSSTKEDKEHMQHPSSGHHRLARADVRVCRRLGMCCSVLPVRSCTHAPCVWWSTHVCAGVAQGGKVALPTAVKSSEGSVYRQALASGLTGAFVCVCVYVCLCVCVTVYLCLLVRLNVRRGNRAH